MGVILIRVLLPLGVLLSLFCLLHCLVTRRGVAWFLITLLLGPLGGIVYLLGLYEKLPFSAPETPAATATAARRCPRCQQSAGMLYDYEDGRTTIHICQMCKSELELRHSNFKLPS